MMAYGTIASPTTSTPSSNTQRHVATDQHVQSRADKDMGRRVNRKMDVALLPFLSVLYLTNGLDRANVGFGETQGFSRDIGCTPDDFNFAVALFFVPFVLLQPPSAAVGRWLGARHWIAIMMIGWGTVTLAHAFIYGRAALIAARLLVGAFEAGFYPTAVAYLSMFYCRYDLAVRLALFFGQYAVAGAFSGAIAYGIFHFHGDALHNWQYLFIIEGCLTILLAAVAWFWLPNSPATAWFLDDYERVFVTTRILNNDTLLSTAGQGSGGAIAQRLSKRDVMEACKDWKTWYVLVFNMCASVPSQAFSIFLPLVVQGLGYSSIEANLMSVPPYICGAVGLFLFALSSDRHEERGYHIIGGIAVALIGLVATVTASNNAGKYAGLCILLLGSYIAPPLTAAWLSGNTPEPKRSVVLGINGFGNLAGVIGAQLYRSRYAPQYLLPFYVTLGFVVTALVGYISYRQTLRSVNRSKCKTMAGKTEEEIAAEQVNDVRYADRKWTFIYGL